MHSAMLYSPSNGILSLVALRCYFMVLFSPFHYGIASVPLFFFPTQAPPAPPLPLSPTYLMPRTGGGGGRSCLVNRIRGGPQEKEIGEGENKLPQKKTPPELK